MTRHAVEISPPTLRLVRAHKHSPDARGIETMDFAKAMIGVQSLPAPVREGQEGRPKEFDRVPDEPQNDRSSQDTRVAPRPDRFVKDVTSAPAPMFASDLHETEPRMQERICAAVCDAAIEECAVVPVFRSPVAPMDVRENAEPLNPRVFGKPPTEHAIQQLRNLEDGASSRDAITSTALFGGDIIVGETGVVLAPSNVSEIAPPLIDSQAFAVDVPDRPFADGGAIRAPGRSASPVSVPEMENRFVRMSVRIDFGVEPTHAVRERDEEAGAAPQWDIVSQRFQNDAAPLLDAVAETVRGAASAFSSGWAINEGLPKSETVFPGNASLAAITAMTNASPRVAGQVTDNKSSLSEQSGTPSMSRHVPQQNSTRTAAVAKPKILDVQLENAPTFNAPFLPEVSSEPQQSPMRADPVARPRSPDAQFDDAPATDERFPSRNVSAPPSHSAASSTGLGTEPADDLVAKRDARAFQIPVQPKHPDFASRELDEPDNTPALSVALASNAPRFSISGGGAAVKATQVQFESRRVPPDAGLALSRSSPPTHMQVTSESGAPARGAAAAFQMDGTSRPMHGAVHTLNVVQAEPARSKRGLDDDAIRPARSDAPAAGNMEKPSVREEERGLPRTEPPPGSPAGRYSPLVSSEAALAAGQATAGQASGSQPQSLQQILSALQLELSALKRPESSPLKQLKIRLHPESLGEVDVTLKKHARGILVQLDASLGSTASALRAAKDELAAALEELGFDRASLSIEVKAVLQASIEQEAPAGRDLQQARSGIDQQNLAEQHGGQRRERNTDEGRNEEIDRGSRIVGNTSAAGSRRGVYV